MRKSLELSLVVLAAAALVVSSAACDSKSGSHKQKEKAEAEPTDQKEKEKGSEEKKAESEEDEPAEMTEYELDEGHEQWKGWVAQAPKGMKVMKGGIKGVRLAGEGGPYGLDVTISSHLQDIEQTKKSAKEGASKSDKTSIEIVAEKEGELRYTSTYDDGDPKWIFLKHMEIGDREVTCKNNPTRGYKNKKLVEQAIELCKSIHKADGESKGESGDEEE